MSGFGLKSLKKQNTQDKTANRQSYSKNLVVGDSIYAAPLLAHLNDSLLLSTRPLTKENIEFQLSTKIELDRSADYSGDVLFYKDGKLHKIGGRAQPLNFLKDEDYFTRPFKDQNVDYFNQDIESIKQERGFVSKITLCTPDDMVEPVHFQVHTSDHSLFSCENLYWLNSPKSLYKLIENKKQLADSYHEYCLNLQERTSLTVEFKLSSKLFENDTTVLLPQSLTHDWGHFVADISDAKAKVMMFVTDSVTTEDELAKKVKLLKRVFTRVFNLSDEDILQESINFRDEDFFSGHKDELAGSMQQAHPNLLFIGEAAPVGSGAHMQRGINSILNLGLHRH